MNKKWSHVFSNWKNKNGGSGVSGVRIQEFQLETQELGQLERS